MRWVCLLLLIATAGCLADTASALEVVWSNGTRDMAVEAATQCTLLVRVTRIGETLPTAWDLVWTGEAEGVDSPLRIEPGASEAGFADVCELIGAVALADVRAHCDTVVHCDPNGTGRATTARYLIRIASHATARIKLLLTDPESGEALEPQVGDTLEATMNGGGELAYPPVLLGGQAAWLDGQLVVTARGADLGRSLSAVFEAGTSGEHTPLQVLARSSTWLSATASVGGALPVGYLAVADTDGQTSLVAMEGESPSEAALVADDHFLVRFRSGEVEPPTGATGGLAATLQFQSSVLQDSLLSNGVLSLERLLPWFQHSDVNATNALGEPVVLEDLADLYIASVEPGSGIAETVERISQLPEVLYASSDVPIQGATTIPNDSLFGYQWGLRNTGQQICGVPGIRFIDIGVSEAGSTPAAWDITTGTPDVRIGILDTGIDNQHLDLIDRAVLDTSFAPTLTAFDDDPARHGTAVAGIAAAVGNNHIGVAGVAWRASPWAIKVLNSNGVGLTSWLMRGIDVARMQGIPIINMSLSASSTVTAESLRAVNDVCLNAFLAGDLLVASSGNVVTLSGQDQSGPRFPAAFSRRVFAVGAMLQTSLRWRDEDFLGSDYCNNPVNGLCQASNFGPWLDVLAPGGRFIVTTRNGPNSYYTVEACDLNDFSSMGFGGTSAAAPVVSGVAALLKSRSANLAGEDMEQLMVQTALNLQSGFGNWDQENGWGYVRADGALDLLARPQKLVHRLIIDTGASTGHVSIVDSALVSRVFLNVPGLPSNFYPTNCVRYRLRVGDNSPPGFSSPPRVWVRASGTAGWRDTTIYDYSEEVPWAKLLSFDAESAVFETFVFRILDQNDQNITLGWFPLVPASARVAYTALGPDPNQVGVDARLKALDLQVQTTPNPALNGIAFDLRLPSRGLLRMTVMDVLGREVVSLGGGEFEAGPQRIRWEGKSQDGTMPRRGLLVSGRV